MSWEEYRHEGRYLRTIGARGRNPPRRSQGRRQHGRARGGVDRHAGRADAAGCGAGRACAPRSSRSPASAPASRPTPTGRRSARSASSATKANVKEGEFAGVELTLHGPQQPEPAQRAVPRPAEAVGGIYRRQDHLDRPRAGRLQRPPAAGGRDRHGRLRRHRDGRAVRGRRLRQGPGFRSAGLGQEAGRYGRLCRLPARRRSAPGTARPIACRSTATATPSATAPTSSPTPRSRKPGRPRADRANGACRRPGSRCRPPPSS